MPHSPDGLTPANIFCWSHWGNHKAFFSSPMPLHLWKNSCHLTRCPQKSASCKVVGLSVVVTAPCDKGQCQSSAGCLNRHGSVCLHRCSMQGMILHSLLLQECNRSESVSPAPHTDTRVKFIILFAALFQDN